MRKDYLTTFLAAGFFFAGAFLATFFAGAFFTVAFFFAGAFLAGISYPPFHSAVAEDKTQITIGLTNEQSKQRQSEIITTSIFHRRRKCFSTTICGQRARIFAGQTHVARFIAFNFCATGCDRNHRSSELAARVC
jgi:hypothetical protein